MTKTHPVLSIPSLAPKKKGEGGGAHICVEFIDSYSPNNFRSRSGSLLRNVAGSNVTY